MELLLAPHSQNVAHVSVPTCLGFSRGGCFAHGGSLLRHNSRSHRINRGPDAAQMQHGIEPPLVASLYRARPRIGSGGLGMPLQVEDVDDTLPHGLALERLFDGLTRHQHGFSAVLAFNGSLELVCAHIHERSLPRFTARSFRTVHLLPPRMLGLEV